MQSNNEQSMYNPNQLAQTNEAAYKEYKYHMKIQKKLKEIQQHGGNIPQGYERYLGPFFKE